MIKKVIKLLFASCIMLTTVIPNGSLITQIQGAEETSTEYTIYPKPQAITYDGGSHILRDVNVIYDDAIDQYTKNRLLEVASLKGLQVEVSDKAVKGKTNIYVGVYGSNGAADTYIQNTYAPKASLFKETDSYFLTSDDSVIAVLGRDTDASFYGLTTLYHVFSQLDSLTIRNFTVQDYADIAYRGFIEGYYGNPWSNDDRAELMKFGGYYKMNQYAFAPKDDPYHNSKWRELYPDAELENIKRLASVGNESKCRYVWTIHPFMSSAFNFNNYENDLSIIKAKFDQLLASGVRQFGVLADDAAGVSVENTSRLLGDITTYLNEKKATYPDLKSDILYCPAEYYYDVTQLAKYSALPENVQVATTGGKIWGEVKDSYLSSFTKTVGRKGYMWVNWPCTDNSKKHLIMGGYADFLQPGVDKDNIQGSILNPMQQSEPSKVGIFGNAAYTWNIWETEEEADQAWKDSFSFVDHNTAVETQASTALRELSKHMINQAMDSRVRVLEESVELKEILNPVKKKFANDTYTIQELNKIIDEFKVLQEAAKTYREQGNTKLLGDLKDYTLEFANEQMGPWIDCWDDTTTAALAYLQAIKDYKNGNTSSLLNNYAKAQAAFTSSKSIELHYRDHMENAEVGVQHIVPFIKEMDSYIARKVKEIADPNSLTYTYISDVFTTPYSGSVENLFDFNDETAVEFHNPNYIYKDNYIGVTFNRPIELNDVRIVSAGGKNHFYKSKLQYTTDNKTWMDIPNASYDRPRNSEEPILAENLNIKNVVGVRMIARENNVDDSWLNVKSFDINKPKEPVEENKPYAITEVTLENAVMAPGSGAIKNISDGDINTETWLRKTNDNVDGKDTTPANAAFIVDLGEQKEVGSVYFAQSTSSNTDFIDQGVVEYSNDKITWKAFGTLTGKKEETINSLASARYIRVRNTKDKAIWWRVADIQVFAPDEGVFNVSVSPVDTMIGRHGAINDGAKNNKFEYIVDGNETTLAWIASANPDNGNIQNGQGIEVSFGRKIDVQEIRMLQASDDNVSNLKFLYKDGDAWKDLDTITDAKARIKIEANRINTDAIRIVNNGGDTKKWWKIYEVEVISAPKASKENVYSNVKNNFVAVVNKEEASLSKGSIELKKDEYVGINFGSIQNIASIAFALQTKTNPIIETSMNGSVWTEVKLGSQTNIKAQFIRVRNNSNTAITYAIDELRVAFKTIGKYGELISSDISVISSWGDTRGNGAAFDASMTSVEKFGGQPKKGNSAVFSLGQDIDIDSLRIYTQDTQSDFIRDAVVQLSMDGVTWSDSVLTIGDDVIDTFTGSFGEYADVNKKADSNYPNVFYYGNDDIHQKARYVRILITADYPSRALAINSIMINKGKYISSESNASFEGTLEAPGHLPSYMLDGDLTTTYRPSEANGSLTYNFAKGDGVRAIRFIQNGEASEAIVKANVFNTTSNLEEEMVLGTMAQAINEFNIPEGYIILSTTISWSDKLPEISEIITMNFADDATNAKVELKKKIDEQPSAYATWTKDAKVAYDDMKRLARLVYDSPKASKTMFENAASALQNLMDTAEINANQAKIEALQTLVDEKISNEYNVYTSRSYQAYENAIAKVQASLVHVDNIADTYADSMIALVQTTKDALQLSTYNRELAEINISTFTTITEANYSKKSYATLKSLFDELTKLIDDDKKAVDEAHRVNPTILLEKSNAYSDAKKALVDITELKALIAINKNEELYTATTWKTYADAKKAAQDALDSVSTSASEITTAYENLQKAEKSLMLKSTIEIDAFIEELNNLNEEDYTENSYTALKNAIDKAVTDMEQGDDALNRENIQSMNRAKDKLVSIVSLREKLEEIAKLDKTQYTKDSYKDLEDAIEATNDVKKQGSTQDVADAVKELNKQRDALVFNATQLDAYREAITLKTPEMYTPKSYAIYKEAYDALMALESGNTSIEEFQSKQDAFEKAEAALKIQKADYTKIEEILTMIPNDLSQYTEASVKALQDVIDQIDYTLDASKQNEVDAYANALLAAISKLELINQGNPSTPDVNPDGGNTNPGNGNTSSGGAGTGDNTSNPIIYMCIMTACIGLAWIIRRKKMYSNK